jgi:predicted O-methyltransferase YrrM
MEITPTELQQYAEMHTSPEGDLLKTINQETHAQVLMHRMLSGQIQGRFLSMVSHMIKPDRILEIGTYTGYSALCFAEGLSENGKIITIDINEELERRVRKSFNESPFNSKIDYRIGNALEIIPTINEIFDLIFIDADKINYSQYYELVFNKLKVGGFLMADNVLWSGKILSPSPDKDTRAILEFNKKVQQDPHIENVLLTIRDGIMLVRKISNSE